MSNAAKFKASSEHVESKCMKVRTLSEAVMEQIGQWIFDGTFQGAAHRLEKGRG